MAGSSSTPGPGAGPAPGLADDAVLPALRGELQILAGPAALNGEPTWMIVDPLRGSFFQLGCEDVAWLDLWPGENVGSLCAAYRERHARDGDRGRLEALHRFLSAHRLVSASGPQALASLAQERARQKQGGWRWLLHHYLFVRIPLVSPDRWLQPAARLLRPLFGGPMLVAVAAVAVFGLYLVGRQWEAFWQTLPEFFTLEGLLVYGLGLIVCKTLHELGHALMATHLGCRVGTMGVAWVVMVPMLYTDTTDVWRLRSHRDRMRVDAAGVFAELALAAVASVLWAFLPDGPLRSVCFVLATTSWALTLAINLSPFLRFDGYYLLADAIRMPNLHARAQAFGCWWLRRTLFGLQAPLPESVSDRRRRFLIGFALATWLYRLVLFVGIAVAVYHFFFKALGVLLFVVELAWFIGRPVMNELRIWRQAWAQIRRQPRTWVTAAGVMAALIALALPLDRHVDLPAVLGARVEIPVHAPEPARVDERHVGEGDRVEAGQPLLRLASPELDQQEKEGQIRLALLRARVERSAADPADRARLLEWQQAVVAEQANLEGIARRRALLDIAAPFGGRIYELDPTLGPGRWVNRHDPLLRIVADQGGVDLRGFSEASAVWRIQAGAEGRFVPEDPGLPSFPVRVTAVAAIAAERLDSEYLASTHGGAIAVVPDPRAKEPVPVSAQYPVRLQPLGDDGGGGGDGRGDGIHRVDRVVRGTAIIAARPESLLERGTRRVLAVLARESGL